MLVECAIGHLGWHDTHARSTSGVSCEIEPIAICISSREAWSNRKEERMRVLIGLITEGCPFNVWCRLADVEE